MYRNICVTYMSYVNYMSMYTRNVYYMCSTLGHVGVSMYYTEMRKDS